MNHSTRNILIAVGAIVIIGCLCIAVIVIGGLGFFFTSSSTSSGPTLPAEFLTTGLPIVTESPFNPQENTSDSTPSPTGPPEDEPNIPTEETASPSSSEISLEIAEEMDIIEDQVVELRGLQPSGSVSRALLTPAQLRQRVMDDFLEDYSQEEAQEDALILSVFGLLAPDFDLYNLYVELFSEQIAGFYDDESKEMYVIQGEGFLGPERLTYAHEYTHALQDLNYDFENGLLYTDEACEEDSERCAAIQALIEGDASLSEFEWFANFATSQDALEIQEFYNDYESPVYDSAPVFLKEDFLFPYSYGQSFVEYLFDNGGWTAVDEAYRNLPVTTEQILHPERYPDDKPIEVDLQDFSEVLGDGWREIDRGVMGEWYTYLILALGNEPSARLAEDFAKEASSGWGGDTYLVYSNDNTGKTAVILATKWETQEDVDQFFNAFSDYATNRYGSADDEQEELIAWEYSNGYTAIHLDGLETIWISAPDSSSGHSMWDAMNSP